ncbi:hypothetical protein MKQ70_32730 [Chitinophaga sedimenti]|nr:hypothetical protein [Chitinophaga sedimenti]MCK7559482.1 hypothetical protein [Chitinophaga sedimenti]
MEKLSPEKVVELLQKEGIEVTVDQAEDILRFLRELAKEAVRQILKK